jgi:hypothetical protein
MSSSQRIGRAFLIAILPAVIAGVTLACHKNSPAPSTQARAWRMGFAASAPRPTLDAILQSLNIYTGHADAAIISTEVPWDSLLNGADPAKYVANTYTSLVNIYRAKNMLLWVYIDPENGLDRRSDSHPLVARGKSIAQPDIQNLYRRFVIVMDSLLHPDHLGLALETNLIRLAAPDSIYQGVRQAVNSAAIDVRSVDPNIRLSISIQAEVAWGKLAGTGNYVGIDIDLKDFPFIQELGVSSYPYMSFQTPDDIPLDYYSRLAQGHVIPIFVSEGGWTSADLPALSIHSSPAQQRLYIRRQAQLLAQAKAIGLFQLTFTDLSINAWPADVSTELAPFAWLGMVDSNFNPKPALSAWDSIRSQPLK